MKLKYAWKCGKATSPSNFQLNVHVIIFIFKYFQTLTLTWTHQPTESSSIRRPILVHAAPNSGLGCTGLLSPSPTSPKHFNYNSLIKFSARSHSKRFLYKKKLPESRRRRQFLIGTRRKWLNLRREMEAQRYSLRSGWGSSISLTGLFVFCPYFDRSSVFGPRFRRERFRRSLIVISSSF